MNETAFIEEELENEFRTKFNEWIECGKCRALMFDTFVTCWSCGSPVTGKNRVPVRL